MKKNGSLPFDGSPPIGIPYSNTVKITLDTMNDLIATTRTLTLKLFSLLKEMGIPDNEIHAIALALGTEGAEIKLGDILSSFPDEKVFKTAHSGLVPDGTIANNDSGPNVKLIKTK